MSKTQQTAGEKPRIGEQEVRRAAERRMPGGRSRCSGRETRWIRSLQK